MKGVKSRITADSRPNVNMCIITKLYKNFHYLVRLILIVCSASSFVYSNDVAIQFNGRTYYNGQTAYIDCSISKIQPRAFIPGETSINPKIEWSWSPNFYFGGNNIFPEFTLDPNRGDGIISVKFNNKQMTLNITQKVTPTITVVPNLCVSGQSGNYAATLNYYGPNSTNVVWETTGGVTVNGGSFYRVFDNTISSANVQYNSYGTVSVYGEIPGCNNMRTRTETIHVGLPDLSLFTVNTQTYNSIPNICVGSTQNIQAVVSFNTQSFNWSITSGNSYNATFSGYGNSASFTPEDHGYFVIDLQLGNSCGTVNHSISFNAYDCFSSYSVYPNPASNHVTIEFENASDSMALPDEIILFDENSNSAKRLINVQEEYSRNRLKAGSKIEIDTKNLPRGNYYLHIKNNRRKVKQIDIIRLLLE